VSANNVVSSNDVIEALRQKLSDSQYESVVMAAQVRNLNTRIEELEEEIRDLKVVRDLTAITQD
jgi:chaperonin cofactor prefoldin